MKNKQVRVICRSHVFPNEMASSCYEQFSLPNLTFVTIVRC